jgi:hypothetical protein
LQHGGEPRAPQRIQKLLRMYLTADSQLFQIQLHQMLKVGFQILLRETGEKFRLGAFVDFTDAVYQLPFAHTHSSFKSEKVLCNLRNIDWANIFSLAR